MPSLSQLGGQFSSRIAIEEKKLNDIVNDIGSDHDTVMNLGFELDFFKVSIDKYDALNNKSGKVSTAGTREMMFDWKRNTSPENQLEKLRQALIKVKLTEIADTHLPVSDDTMKRNLQTKATLKTSETQTVGSSSLADKIESPELICLKCDRVIAKITDVINTKRSRAVAVRSKVRIIKGKECLVQLMRARDRKTKELTGRYDVITLTTADVKLADEVYPWSSFDGYKEHRCTRCKGCSQQVGWYFVPKNTKSKPFHALWLQRLIHDSYDSDNSLNAFFAKNRVEE